MRRESDKAAPFWCLIGTLHITCPKLSFCSHQPKSAVPSLSHLRECQLQLPRTHTVQSSNPSAKAVGSAFKMYLESDRCRHLCCFSPHHHHLSPGWWLLVRNWTPSSHPCSPTVYSQHTSRRDPFKTCHSSTQNPPVASHLTQSPCQSP